MKAYRVLLVIGLITVVYGFVSLAAGPARVARAQGLPTVSIAIKQTAAGHLYFSPTHPPCVTASSIDVKITNASKQTASLVLGEDEQDYPQGSATLKKSASLTLPITFSSTDANYYDISISEQSESAMFILWCP